MRLSDSQLILLAEAAKRNDGIILIPDGNKASAPKTVAPLIKAKLVEEIPTTAGIPTWRRGDDGAAISLRMTPLGLKAINAESTTDAADGATPTPDEVDHQSQAKGRGASKKRGAASAPTSPLAKPRATPTAKKANRSSKQAKASAAHAGRGDAGNSTSARDAVRPPREGSKLAAVIDMLRRANGASTQELISATGWLPHTARAALTGLRKRGLAIERTTGKRGKESVTIYRIAGA